MHSCELENNLAAGNSPAAFHFDFPTKSFVIPTLSKAKGRNLLSCTPSRPHPFCLMRFSLSPLRGFVIFFSYPRLAPWAAFFRSFGAGVTVAGGLRCGGAGDAARFALRLATGDGDAARADGLASRNALRPGTAGPLGRARAPVPTWAVLTPAVLASAFSTRAG